MYRNSLMERLALDHPIIQAPMAGGGDTPEMVMAVGKAGGLGSMGVSYLQPDRIGANAARVREGSNAGFAVNLFAPLDPPPFPADPGPALDFVRPHYQALGITPPGTINGAEFDFEAQVEQVLDSGASVFSFAFGIMPDHVIDRARQRGMLVMGTATSVAEAQTLEAAGVDAVIAQGAEAGGHRAGFGADLTRAMVGTMALVPQVVSTVGVPVVASGGITDGRGVAAALALGASAAQIGTAFLTTTEAGIPEAHKQAILTAKETDTTLTRAFSGRPARGIRNRVIADGEAMPNRLLDFPYQNALTRALRAEAAKQQNPDFLSLWAGQGLGLARRLSAAELMQCLVEEMQAALASAARYG